MVSIKKGSRIGLKDAKKGRKNNGDEWMLATVWSEKEGSKDRILVFIENASEAKYWNVGVVDEIIEIRKSAKRTGDSWEPSYSFTVHMKGEDTFREAKAGAAEKFEEFMNLDNVEGDELPFN